MTVHVCAVPGCDKQITSHLLMCLPHWRQVPGDLQGEVYRAYRDWHDDPANLEAYHAYRAARKVAVDSLSPADERPLLTPIYLAGYALGGRGSKDGTPRQYCRKPETLCAITSHLGTSSARVIDIRYAAGSKQFPEWNQANLRRVLGARYIWFREWGNLNYSVGGSIQIANFTGGLNRLRVMTSARPAPCILLCACRSADGCHRAVVGQHLAEHGYTVLPLDWGIHLPTNTTKEIEADAELALF